MIPVKDEEAESQRKAKSRQARQTRRATQGVTLSELMEAKRTFSPSKLDIQTGEVCRSTEGMSVQKILPEDTTETSPSLRQEQQSNEDHCEHLDKQGNWKRRPGTKPDRPSFCIASVKGACGFTPSLKSHSTSIESEWTDENDNILYGSYDASLTQQLTEEDCDLSADLTSLLTEVPLSCVCLSSTTH
ncbi:protein phosphatase 1 regulatory subunit 12B-like [Megalobrama amblycephala]|uniref:protein phosphatase 1 regulatory subunit 12B-like n=1 Tax=Megalobrama amblycephala TaxID=75352 RepID=UPI0020146376|nr:protein phosphatase 1 regulatory subunit 12B-like [Megalobrama amblycephala]